MDITLAFNSKQYRVAWENPISLAITQSFEANQPNFFSAPLAHVEPLVVDSFIGDIQQGGSCNVNRITLTAHCNGTHTETVQHISDDKQPVDQATQHGLMPAKLITITPVSVSASTDTYQAGFQAHDRVITESALREALRSDQASEPFALVVRTQPNDEKKCDTHYQRDSDVPVFSQQAIAYLNTLAIQHLLIDLPSLDRVYDSASLPNHQLFWQSDRAKTITELIYVPNTLVDAWYLLSLQTPAFALESAPSRPLLYQLEAL